MGLGDPRVLFKWIDLSGYVGEIPKGWMIVMVQTERGPMWTPTAVSDEEAFIRQFGNTVDWSIDPLWCLKALAGGAKLVVVRIGHCDDITDRTTLTTLPAWCNIPDRGATPAAGAVQSNIGPFALTQALAGTVTGTEVGPYAIATGVNDAFKVTVGTGEAQTVTLAEDATKAAQEVVDEINAQTTDLTAEVVDNTVKITANSVADGLVIGAVANDAYSALGIVEGSYAATAGTQTLSIKVDGGGSQAFTLEPESGETGAFVLTSAQVAAQLAALTGATISSVQGRVTITSSTVGGTSSVQVESSSTADTQMGFDNTAHTGAAGSAINAWKFVLSGPGAYGNGAKIYFYNNKLKPGECMDVRVTIPGSDDVFFSSLTRDDTDPRYWKNYINDHCDIGDIVDVTTPSAAPADWPAINAAGITLAGGDDGTVVLTDSDYAGDAGAKTGFYSIDGVLMPAIDIYCPGTSSEVVHHAGITYTENRAGRFYVGATPPDMTPQETVNWRMGVAPEYSHAAFDSPNAALLYGEYLTLDAKNNAKTYLPATYQLAAATTRTDETQGTAISPFGMKRGRCSGVLGIKHNLSPGTADADLMAEYGVNNARIIHTSVETRGWEGAVLWGGWTTQRYDSALKEYPVVRKMKEYEHLLLPVMLGFVNDPNHPVTWGEIHRTLEPVFRRDLLRYHIYGYFIQTDRDAFFAGGDLKGAVLNLPSDIDQGKYRCRILIKPLRQIFYFIAEMGVMRTGDPFTDYAFLYSLPGWVRK